jgi:hypothetical protein
MAGLLVVVNITGEHEYSYKMPFFAQTFTGLDVFRQKKTRQPGGLAGYWMLCDRICDFRRVTAQWCLWQEV